MFLPQCLLVFLCIIGMIIRNYGLLGLVIVIASMCVLWKLPEPKISAKTQFTGMAGLGGCWLAYKTCNIANVWFGHQGWLRQLISETNCWIQYLECQFWVHVDVLMAADWSESNPPHH